MKTPIRLVRALRKVKTDQVVDLTDFHPAHAIARIRSLITSEGAGAGFVAKALGKEFQR